jgi:probable HAF family extracellular repeat protein
VTGINEQGQVIGYSARGYGSSFKEHSFLWENGTVTDLGGLGGQVTEARDINDRGQIVGYSATKSGKYHAFLWADGKMRDLGILGQVSTFGQMIRHSWAVAINERGQIVGASGSSAPEGLPSDDPLGGAYSHPFLWQNGKMTDLGGLVWHGRVAEATAINDVRQIVGWASVTPKIQHAFLWQNGKMTDLGTLGRGSSWASAINQRGQIVGCNSFGSGPDSKNGLLWRSGSLTDLGHLANCEYGAGVAINERGQVVGGGGKDAFLWQDGKLTSLGWDEVKAINDHGQIVGAAYKGHHEVAALWEDGAFTLLPNLGNHRDAYAQAINNHNQIAGISNTPTGRDAHAVLWTQR